MRHDQPQLIDALAAEYVLGTLRGGARRRFERWRGENWHIASRVQAWEGRLMPLALGLPPLAPAPEVWRAIEERIRIAEASRERASRRTLGRALAAAVLICAVAVGAFFAWRASAPPALQPVAMIKGTAGADAWSIELDAPSKRLRVVALAGAAPRPGHSFELWALPHSGSPVSLGLLPETGRLERTLSAPQRAAIAAASQVAVSLEPTGGSPTGAPTGPVLFTAALKKSA